MGRKVPPVVAAEHLGVSKNTVLRMIARGELRAYRIGPQTIRIDTDDITAALKPIAPKGETA